MAQFNQLQTSASQVINPPADFIAFHFDENKHLTYLDSSGPLVITASILALTASIAEDALQLAPGDVNHTGSFTVSGSSTVIGKSIVSGTLEVTKSIFTPELTASVARITTLVADTASITYLTSIYETSSVTFSSGSTKFGDTQADVHQFTGSVSVSASKLELVLGDIKATSGSFSGSGHNLFGVSASAIVGLNLARISTGSTSASLYEVGMYVSESYDTGSATTSSTDIRGTSSFHVNADTFITGTIFTTGDIKIKAVSGSFSGSGHKLYDISASAIVGLNLARIATSSFSASMYTTSASIVSQSFSASISQSYSASVTQSTVLWATTSFIDATGSFHINADVYVTSSLTVGYRSGSNQVSGANIFGTASWAVDSLFGAPAVVVSGTFPTSQRNIPTGSASGSLWWNTDDGNLYIQATGPTGSTWVPAVSSVPGGTFGATYTNTFTAAATWSVVHGLGTTTPIVQVYSGSQMIIPASIRAATSNSLEVIFASTTAGNIIVSTGVGGPTSSSFALTAATASYAVSYSYNYITQSYVAVADEAAFAETASYVNIARTASYVDTAETASYVEGTSVDGVVVSSLNAVRAYSVVLARTASYLNDAEAEAAGVDLFELYRSGSFVLIRTV